MNVKLFHEGRYHPKHKVPAIKAIRSICGLGLKEAKDVVEAAIKGQAVDLKIGEAYVANLLEGSGEAYDMLREGGFAFGGIATKRTAILDSLRASAVVAIDSKDYELCESIIGVLKKHDHV